MQRAKLTNSAIEKFKCGTYISGERKGQPKEQDTLWCGETKGFGVRLSAKTGTRTYIFVYRVKGESRERYITIGRHNDPWRVDDARAKALALKAQMLGGVDPVEEDRQRREAKHRQAASDAANSTTLRQVLEHYLEHKRTKHGPLRPATQKDMRRHCQTNLATWLDEPVVTITRDKCHAKFTEETKRAPQQANACMIYLRALCNHARELHATEDGNFPVLAVNPVSRLFKLRKPNPEKPSDTRIPLNKIGACWSWLRKRATESRTENDRCAADWVSFVLLTGCRRTESASLRWSDVDFEGKTFTLRADVVKNHSELILPMSTVLCDLLKARQSPMPVDPKVARRRRVQRSAEYVFAGNGRKSPFITNAQTTIEGMAKMAGTHVHVHALRRTFDDMAMECKIDSDQRRMLLNHITGDVHARHYSNSTKALVPAVEAVAQWVLNEAKVAEAIESGANVVAFRGA